MKDWITSLGPVVELGEDSVAEKTESTSFDGGRFFLRQSVLYSFSSWGRDLDYLHGLSHDIIPPRFVAGGLSRRRSDQDDRIAQLDSQTQDLTDRFNNDCENYVFLEQLLTKGKSDAMGVVMVVGLLTIAIRNPELEKISMFLYMDFEHRFDQFVRSFNCHSEFHAFCCVVDIGIGPRQMA